MFSHIVFSLIGKQLNNDRFWLSGSKRFHNILCTVTPIHCTAINSTHLFYFYRNIVKPTFENRYLSHKYILRQMRHFYEKEEIELFLCGYIHINVTLMICKLNRRKDCLSIPSNICLILVLIEFYLNVLRLRN